MNPITALSRLFFPNRPTPQVRPPTPPTALRPVSPDSVHLSGTAQDDDLGQILRHVAAAAEAAKRRTPVAHASAEAEIESLLADIEGAEGPGGSRTRADLPYKITDVAAEVLKHSVHAVRPPLGGGLDVNVEVLASAQHAALFLSFGGTEIDLAGPGAEFTIRVAGPEGARDLTFASGTSMYAIREAVNAVADETGVRATGGETRLALRTDAEGSEKFVSVSVIDDGGINAGAGGIYRSVPDDENTVNPWSRTAFTDGESVRDEGRDVRALVNGVEAVGTGATLRVRTDAFRAVIALTEAAANRVGAFTAFRIVGRR